MNIHQGEIHCGMFINGHGKIWSHSFRHSSLFPSLLPLPQSSSSPSLISLRLAAIRKDRPNGLD